MSDTGPGPASKPSSGPAAKPSGGLSLKLPWRKKGGEEKASAFAAAVQNGEGLASGLSDAKREMIERVIAFDRMRVADVMAPRADIIAVEAETPLPALIRAFSEAGHSRLPVYRGDLDDPVGMVHIKDVIGLLAEPEAGESGEAAPSEPILSALTRDVLYVPPSMPITDLLLRMQAARVHMALVVDEYGGTDGLVTIEDLVEEIVGEIKDEHDDEDDEPSVDPRASGGWSADARVELDDFEEATGIDVSLDGEDEIDTLGGLVFTLAGRVPLRGEVISHPAGVEFEVTDADPRRIRKIRIRRRASPLDKGTDPGLEAAAE